jgi:hypothetical protein
MKHHAAVVLVTITTGLSLTPTNRTIEPGTGVCTKSAIVQMH